MIRKVFGRFVPPAADDYLTLLNFGVRGWLEQTDKVLWISEVLVARTGHAASA